MTEGENQATSAERFDLITEGLHDWLREKNAFWSRMQGNDHRQRIPFRPDGEFRYGKNSIGIWELPDGLWYDIHYTPQFGTSAELFHVQRTPSKVLGRYKHSEDNFTFNYANGLTPEDRALNYRRIPRGDSHQPMIIGIYEEVPVEDYKRNEDKLFTDFWIRDQFERFTPSGVQRVDVFDKFQELIDNLCSAKQISKNPAPLIPYIDDFHIVLLRSLLRRIGLQRIIKL